MSTTPLFLSHSTADDALVRRLQRALADLGEDLWIDARELRGGDLLRPVIQEAIESAAAFAVLVSPAALQSDWVGDELAHALKVQRERGPAHYPVIPLSRDGTRLGVLKQVFGAEPAYIPISSAPGGIDAALNAILIAWAGASRSMWRRPRNRRPSPSKNWCWNSRTCATRTWARACAAPRPAPGWSTNRGPVRAGARWRARAVGASPPPGSDRGR